MLLTDHETIPSVKFTNVIYKISQCVLSNRQQDFCFAFRSVLPTKLTLKARSCKPSVRPAPIIFNKMPQTLHGTVYHLQTLSPCDLVIISCRKHASCGLICIAFGFISDRRKNMWLSIAAIIVVEPTSNVCFVELAKLIFSLKIARKRVKVG